MPFLLPEKTGLVVPAGNESALRRALENLLANPTRAEAMGQRARVWLEQTASYDQRIEQFAQLATGT